MREGVGECGKGVQRQWGQVSAVQEVDAGGYLKDCDLPSRASATYYN